MKTPSGDDWRRECPSGVSSLCAGSWMHVCAANRDLRRFGPSRVERVVKESRFAPLRSVIAGVGLCRRIAICAA